MYKHILPLTIAVLLCVVFPLELSAHDMTWPISMRVGYLDLRRIKSYCWADFEDTELLKLHELDTLQLDYQHRLKNLNEMVTKEKSMSDVNRATAELEKKASAKREGFMRLIQTRELIVDGYLSNLFFAIAKERNLDVIIDSSAVFTDKLGLINSGEDITEAVLRGLEKRYSDQAKSTIANPSERRAKL